eukprot:6188678-Pleurochrysis_carterae.AAC.4
MEGRTWFSIILHRAACYCYVFYIATVVSWTEGNNGRSGCINPVLAPARRQRAACNQCDNASADWLERGSSHGLMSHVRYQSSVNLDIFKYLYKMGVQPSRNGAPRSPELI